MVISDVSLWSNYKFERLNHALVKFVAHIKQQNGSDVTPKTLTNYVMGLQRAFKTRFGYVINIVFGTVESFWIVYLAGVYCVIDI